MEGKIESFIDKAFEEQEISEHTEKGAAISVKKEANLVRILRQGEAVQQVSLREVGYLTREHFDELLRLEAVNKENGKWWLKPEFDIQDDRDNQALSVLANYIPEIKDLV